LKLPLIRPSTTRSTIALWAKSLLNAALFFSVFMVALPAAAHWLLPTPIALPTAVRWILGETLFVAGVSVWLICLDSFSRHGRGTPFPLDAPSQLVTRGPFSVIRNPIIAAEVAVVWGEVAYFASLGLLLYGVLITVAAHLVVVNVEEPELRNRFGDAYVCYCERVPRWFPRLS
jgi:protein-S-isoprenylcysteine O-methyltransferase Ste14